MDHAYPFDPQIGGMAPEIAPGFAPEIAPGFAPELSAAASRMASFLGAGGRAVVLTGPPGSGKTPMMEQLLSGLSGLVTRVRGTPGEPLDVRGMLRQMGEPAPEQGDETALFLRTLAISAYDEYSAVLAIDDAHALTPDALQIVARVPGLGGSVTPGMTLILAGEPSLLAMLAAPGLEVFGNARSTLIARVPPSTASSFSRPPPPAPIGQAHPTARAEITGTANGADLPARTASASWAARHRRDLGLVGGALFAGAALATLGLTWPGFRTSAPILQQVAPAPRPIPEARAPRPIPEARAPRPIPVAPTPASEIKPDTPSLPVPPPAPAPALAPPQLMVPVPVPVPAPPPEPFAAPASVAAPAPGSPPATSVPTEPTLAMPPPAPPAQPVPTAPTTPAPETLQPGPAAGPDPEPSAVAPSPAPLPTPALLPAAPPTRPRVTDAQLRREFDAFLNRAGPDTAKLAPTARAALWHEFLDWRTRKAAARPLQAHPDATAP